MWYAMQFTEVMGIFTATLAICGTVTLYVLLQSAVGVSGLGTMSRGYRDTSTECKVYIGDLSKEAEEKEIERAFGYYGRLKSVWVARNPPGFAFVEYEDPKDAEDAVRALDGT